MTGHPQAYPCFSPEEYLAIERRATYRSEYLNGEIFAMAEASRQHNRIVTNLVTSLDTQLHSRSCNMYANNMRIHIPSTGYFTYPDLVVTCGEEVFTDTRHDVLLNPLVLIEVLSDSTASHDRGKKFEYYQELESFREYLLIDQHRPKVEQFLRQTSPQWLYTETRTLEGLLTVSSIDCSLSMGDIYHKVEWVQQPVRVHTEAPPQKRF